MNRKSDIRFSDLSQSGKSTAEREWAYPKGGDFAWRREVACKRFEREWRNKGKDVQKIPVHARDFLHEGLRAVKRDNPKNHFQIYGCASD